jgi:hypothetical protein
MNKLKTAVMGLGIFAGIGGATHGPGVVLQGSVAPSEPVIMAWPGLTALGGEPAMTVIPNYVITGILAIIVGLLVTMWAVRYVERRMGGLILIGLSVVMLLVGGGIVPPFFGIAAGILGAFLNYNTARHGARGA